MTGDAARDAAVAAGVISENEALPNDMFTLDERRILSHSLADHPEISMLDENRPWESSELTGRDLVSLFEGTYSGDPIYGLSVGGPVATNVTIANGHVTAASKVYLP